MIEKTVQIKNQMGLHARPSAKFVKLASKYPCNVELVKDGFSVNGKSILGVMSLAAEKGSMLTIQTDGEQETEALNELVNLLEQFAHEDTTK